MKGLSEGQRYVIGTAVTGAQNVTTTWADLHDLVARGLLVATGTVGENGLDDYRITSHALYVKSLDDAARGQP